ncbi:26S protease regulatory subunit 6a [Culex quinquefasciatus]|uniref:26S protease regulatory subunit 6a n=1 Tax=Culex quinquefasciatus TaxID=7176 RepID=B0X095_CULQU|nr:26S protease regulatory subunit 6a [Culex quinquefasciatus]|eukprot:XP_001863067.1 26S protease regulatory subunit 6a [Culex quinquefasciatus]
MRPRAPFVCQQSCSWTKTSLSKAPEPESSSTRGLILKWTTQTATSWRIFNGANAWSRRKRMTAIGRKRIRVPMITGYHERRQDARGFNSLFNSTRSFPAPLRAPEIRKWVQEASTHRDKLHHPGTSIKLTASGLETQHAASRNPFPTVFALFQPKTERDTTNLRMTSKRINSRSAACAHDTGIIPDMAVPPIVGALGADGNAYPGQPMTFKNQNHSIAGRRGVNNNLDLEADGLEAQKQLAEKQLAWSMEQPKRRQASRNILATRPGVARTLRGVPMEGHTRRDNMDSLALCYHPAISRGSSFVVVNPYFPSFCVKISACSGLSKAPATEMAVILEDKSIELLYVDPQETEDDGVVVVTYFLPVIGLVDPEKLKPGDLVGVNMTRTSSWRHFRPSTTRALRRWRWTNGPPSSNRTLAGWTVVLLMPRKDKFKNLGIYPPKGVLHAVDSYLCGANKVDLPEAGRATASADVHRRRCQARPGRVRTSYTRLRCRRI